MEDLTSTELRVLNNVSEVLNPGVSLGDRLQSVIQRMPKIGTPVNAVNASLVLTFSDVVVHGETIEIGQDVYEFLADSAQSKSDPNNIGVDIESSTTKSSVTLTMDTQPTAGDKVTIGEKVYTFVPLGTDTADGEVSIGDNLVGAQANLFAAINGIDNLNTPHPLVSAASFVGNDCVITALIGGTIGDSIDSTETFTAGSNVFNHPHLDLGADCSATNAAIAFTTSVTESDTAGVGATRDTAVVTLTADNAGALGNEIGVSETLANGSFADDADSLSGGVDGTVGYVDQHMVDDTYLYVCIADNTVSDSNWRRIELGVVF